MVEKSKKIVVTFPKELVDQPIVYKLIKEHNLTFNILKARITPSEEGLLILEIRGESGDVDKGVSYLKKQGVKIEPLSKDIVVDWDKCIQCGVCVAQCPTQALFVKDKKKMAVEFDSSKCIACELCIDPCPVRCITISY